MTAERILAFIGAFFVAGLLYRITDQMVFKQIGRSFDRRRYARIKANYEKGDEDVNLCYGSTYITFNEWLAEGKPDLPMRGQRPVRLKQRTKPSQQELDAKISGLFFTSPM